MIFRQYYSGSKNNLYAVMASGGQRLLIEAGCRWSLLQKALEYDLNNISACFCTHEHKDHSKAIKDVTSAGIDVYSSYGTFDALGLLRGRNGKIIKDKDLVRLDDFEVLCFETHHDAAEPLGFVIREKAANEYLLFATDTKCISQNFERIKFNIIAIECSYDKEILQQRVDEDSINENLAKRLLTSHFEKSNAKKYIKKFCDLSKLREIHLLHLSKENIDAEKTRLEFEQEFFVTTITAEAGQGCRNLR